VTNTEITLQSSALMFEVGGFFVIKNSCFLKGVILNLSLPAVNGKSRSVTTVGCEDRGLVGGIYGHKQAVVGPGN